MQQNYTEETTRVPGGSLKETTICNRMRFRLEGNLDISDKIIHLTVYPIDQVLGTVGVNENQKNKCSKIKKKNNNNK